MTQPTEPNGCLSCLVLIIAGFVVIYIGSSIWEGVMGEPEKEWLCWSEVDREMIRWSTPVNSTCYKSTKN